jgi:hypothetical protein
LLSLWRISLISDTIFGSSITCEMGKRVDVLISKLKARAAVSLASTSSSKVSVTSTASEML